MRQAPSLSGVVERALERERGEVVDEADFRGVGELNEPVPPVSQPFGEIAAIYVLPLENFARLEAHFPNARTSVQAGALVEHAVANDQPLRERLRIVRERVHNE